ncbi:ubiquitin-conjugating enzyme E2 J2-like [Watersipora subatra]|uniref:ubiquitin-conjugating enzyme E2 J2-like n=1 Tax=Watersipora subatra TaxID=2589382 RepID=UPI00355BF11F
MASNTPKKEAQVITAHARLRKDYLRLMSDPVPYVIACPKADNLLHWHYVLTGPEDSPFAGGYYHGRLVFPQQYPFKPPSILMITPNGRFKCNVRLCLSMSDFHPESWIPSWSTSTILTGLLSFMLEDEPAVGCLKSSMEVKRNFAAKSIEFNLADREFWELFPDLAKELEEQVKQKKVHQGGDCTNNPTNS